MKEKRQGETAGPTSPFLQGLRFGVVTIIIAETVVATVSANPIQIHRCSLPFSFSSLLKLLAHVLLSDLWLLAEDPLVVNSTYVYLLFASYWCFGYSDFLVLQIWNCPHLLRLQGEQV
ncbi:uncharacterized protein LOC104584569 isoform X2 [Brachypodium distachyon]|uniref:uncharacterized protein LOC104584569 isoform X2 n=1 Tax=Brachypodium distachyon TaxID=15368 RepID=UPI000D0DF95A|nr:uncharacterized protein LOC104584569 isoform X2 [Brachypodium distachyon]|eukprot:XP_024318466.1 uncharacterized protein LOC104584569 isoform X2 [Brachypodium distachyon]